MEPICKSCALYKMTGCVSANCAACVTDLIDGPGCHGVERCRKAMLLDLQTCRYRIPLMGEWNQKTNVAKKRTR